MGDLDLPTVRRALGAGAALVLVGLAAWWLSRPAPVPVEESLPMASAAAAAPTDPAGAATAGPSSSAPAEVVVHAAGAVARPGVYRLDPGARVDDLIAAAGGLDGAADASRVNLAAPVADGSRVYVPRQGEEVPTALVPDGAAPGPGTGIGGDPATGAPTSGPIDLNTADEAALESLPGVGPATAQAIIAHRDQVGRFSSVEELLDVRGIGEAKLEQIRPLVTV